MMKKPSVDEMKKIFTGLVLPFYDLKRDMQAPLADRRAENDAEHSWSLGLIACALAARLDPELDVGKIAQLCLVHDLVEVKAEDTSVWDSQALKTKHKREKEALAVLEQEYVDFPWIAATIREYESKSSPESAFVWAVDKYIATFMRLLDHEAGYRFYKDEIGLTIDDYVERIEATRQKAHAHPAVGEMYEIVYREFINHPEWFAPRPKAR